MPIPNHVLRFLFFLLVRVLVIFMLGLNIKRRNLLPKDGPAIVIANHNSHLDTLVLISLFPLNLLPRIRPVAAADYFLRNPVFAWFSTRVIGIIPIQRGSAQKGFDPLTPCYEALDQDMILVLFPEGSRGEPERLSRFKKGVAWLVERYPTVPVTPVLLYGLGKALPKNDFVLVPFFCDVLVGENMYFNADKHQFMALLTDRFAQLTDEGHFPDWE